MVVIHTPYPSGGEVCAYVQAKAKGAGEPVIDRFFELPATISVALFNQSKVGVFMKTCILSLATIATMLLAIPAAQAGSCDHSWQTASDGSNCGGRAADQRAGGRP